VLISIVIPTLNEESRIERALKSIREQTINQDEIEILIIDGGSKDRTREIAENYGAKILENPKVVPEEAVMIGLSKSIGKYIAFMGSDEELTDRDQLKKKIQLFQDKPDVKAVLVNCLNTPKGYPNLTRYANSLGDPFTYFVYRFDSEDLIHSIDKRKYTCKKTENGGRIYYLKKGDIAPIGDGGAAMLDFEYLKANFNEEINNPDFVATKFDDVIYKTGCFGIIEGDTINHYTSAYMKTYLKKLKFRVITNLNPKDNISGYTARAMTNKKLNNRKYLYLLYCLLPPVVLVDSAAISIRKKDFVFMLHFVFVYYVLFQIIYYSFKKLIGKKSENKNYGK
jgi:glycosyltransferase involved in cell wall biosynthesis